MFSIFLFCFKQKTAYEMRISDWSSDVCSSDLPLVFQTIEYANDCTGAYVDFAADGGGGKRTAINNRAQTNKLRRGDVAASGKQIGRASCRERVCQYV